MEFTKKYIWVGVLFIFIFLMISFCAKDVYLAQKLDYVDGDARPQKEYDKCAGYYALVDSACDEIK